MFGRMGLMAKNYSSGSAAFSPADLDNLEYWFDGNDTDTILDASGDPVTNGVAIKTWVNKANAATNLEQGTSGNRPTWISSSGFTGAAVNFDDASSQFLAVVSPVSFNQPCTVFVAWRPLSGSVAGNYLYNTSGSNIFYNYAATNYAVFGGAGSIVDGAYADNVAASSFQIWNNTSSSVWKNGSLVLSGTTGTQAFSALTLCAAAGGGNPMKAEIAEFIVVSESASTDTMAQVQAYFEATHGTP